MTLDQLLLAAGAFKGLTLWSAGERGWQANLTRDGHSWRVEVRSTPDEALRAVLTQPSPKPTGGIFD